MHAFYLSAAHKSSGKTTLSIGLSALFAEQYSVQTFKKGPDYIDPIWLSLASKNPCYNLDFWNMNKEEIKELYVQKHREINIIEGNKGLFDGLNTLGGDANADLAKLLHIPIVLVIDCIGMTRGIAPLLQGYQHFDKDITIAGVIFNKVGGARHEAKLIQAAEYYTDIAVLGSVHKHAELGIDERHLGLKPANEDQEAVDKIAMIKNIVRGSVDSQKILEHTHNATPQNSPLIRDYKSTTKEPITIAVAKDRAFGFYYNDDLEKLKAQATVVFFDALSTPKLPACDGLFIGGGFPETHLKELSNNTTLLTDIKAKIVNGLPTYAECGGMMYLTQSIDNYPMVGVIDAHTETTKKPIGRGYMKLEANHHPWGVKGTFHTHEFHYSHLMDMNEQDFAFKVQRGQGITGEYDGIVKYNLLATYTHQRAVGKNTWVDDFIRFIQDKKS